MSFNWVKYKAPCLSRRLLPNCNASSGCKKERNKRVGISKRICCNHQRSTYIYVYLYVIEISRNSIVVCLRFGGKYRLEEVMVRRWIHMVVTPKLVEYGKWWMCYGFGSIPLPILAFSLGTLFLLRLPTRLVQQASPLFAFVLRSVSLSFLLFLFIFLSSFFFLAVSQLLPIVWGQCQSVPNQCWLLVSNFRWLSLIWLSKRAGSVMTRTHWRSFFFFHQCKAEKEFLFRFFLFPFDRKWLTIITILSISSCLIHIVFRIIRDCSVTLNWTEGCFSINQDAVT